MFEVLWVKETEVYSVDFEPYLYTSEIGIVTIEINHWLTKSDITTSVTSIWG
jgi:hypothetical protein